jgi:hypothetical protein
MNMFTHPLERAQSISLSGTRLLEYTASRRACSKVTRAVRVAAISGWAIAICAGVVMIAGISTSDATWMGLLMTIAAFIEFRARERLRRLETSAARTLGCNQLVLGLLIVLYAAWNINSLKPTSSGPIDLHFMFEQASLRFLSGHVPSGREFNLVLYGLLGIIATLTQGTAAWYCFSREKWIREYVSFAPGWIVQMQRAGASF